MKTRRGLFVCCIFAVTLLLQGAPASNDSIYAPLHLYEGSWRVIRKDQPAGAKPEELVNQCAIIGSYFACQQSVNGAVVALQIFVPDTSKPGHYFTQSVNLQGRALGKAEVDISGNRWVFLSTWNQGGGSVTHYQTLNVFTGRDHIHFEQQESSNGRDWTTKNSGDETRVVVRR
jgi:hypothetical protein